MGNLIESLESRVLFSSSLLAPSALEGEYKGTAVIEGTEFPVLVKISSTKISLTITGFGTESTAISAKEFKHLRQGNFVDSRDFHGTVVSCDCQITSGGKRIAGSIADGSGAGQITGTVVLHKT